jgi:predicted nucleic acid-binding protein
MQSQPMASHIQTKPEPIHRERTLILSQLCLQCLHDILLWLDSILADTPLISFVTKMELLAYNPSFVNDRVLAYRQAIQTFVNQAYMFGIDDEVIREGIRIRKTTKIKLPDAIIGATAIVHDLVLISDNDKDFEKVIPLGLQYLNPINIP